MIRISIIGNPPRCTYQSGQKTRSLKGYVTKYMDPKVKAVFDKMTLDVKAQLKGRQALEGPVTAKIEWIWPYKTTTPMKDRLARKLIPCDKRPDQDNLQKGLWDSLTRAGVLKDDAQVYSCHFAKYYGPSPGIYITLKNNAA